MKKRFAEEQIIGFLKQAEAVGAVKDICRKHGFSDASFYNWRAKYGAMSVSEVRRLRPSQRPRRIFRDASGADRVGPGSLAGPIAQAEAFKRCA